MYFFRIFLIGIFITVFFRASSLHANSPTNEQNQTKDFIKILPTILMLLENQESMDSDHDGITDTMESTTDTDYDGVADKYESRLLDSDNDGINDEFDPDNDSDGDGLPNCYEADNGSDPMDPNSTIPPVASDDNLTIFKGNEPTTLYVASNDIYPSKQTLYLNIVQTPQHGNISINNHTIIYTPDNNYTGSDIFTYRLNDGTEQSDTAVVRLSIKEPYSMFFYNDTQTGIEPWRSDGTPEGTFLLKDINTQHPYITDIKDVILINSTIYFIAKHPLFSNWTLWRSDGTTDGTSMLKSDVSPDSLLHIDNTLYFSAYDPKHGWELWKSDGTETGTVLVKDIYSGIHSSYPARLYKVNEILYFIANDDIHGSALWKSDGTEEGTVLVKDINTETKDLSVSSDMFNLNGTLYFTTDDGIHGYELWKSDGTEEGTVLVKDINPNAQSASPQILTATGTTLFFTAYEPTHGNELWKTDGTANGTVLVKDIYPGTNSSFPYVNVPYTEINGTFCFSADDGVHGRELWKSDGTENGTVLVKDILQGSSGSIPLSLYAIKGILYFVTYDEWENMELWRSDGTKEGTVRVKTIGIIGDQILNSALTAENDTFYFIVDHFSNIPNDKSLWKSDGTEQNTVPISAIGSDKSPIDISFLKIDNHILYMINKEQNTGIYSLEYMNMQTEENNSIEIKDTMRTSSIETPYHSEIIFINGIYYFVLDDNIHGYELWRTDGTSKGTYMLKDINKNGSAYPSSLTAFEGILYFSADDGIHGIELWKTDGTSSGTIILKEINDNTDSAYPSFFTKTEDALYFTANDGIHGSELWKTDGSRRGTIMLQDINEGNENTFLNQFISVTNNETLYFVAYNKTYGSELWKTNGTKNSTVIVKDISPGSGDAYPSYLTQMNETLYFTTDHGLWKSDGTAEGTILIKTAPIYNLTATESRLYFSTSLGEIWSSDGTTEGTYIIKDNFQSTSSLFGIENILYFVGETETYGRELWKSNGTNEGTSLVKDIYPGTQSSEPIPIMALNSQLYFVANDTHKAWGLWQTDGTEEGTILLENLHDDIYDVTHILNTIGNKIIMETLEQTNKKSLYATDGTEEGTIKLTQ